MHVASQTQHSSRRLQQAQARSVAPGVVANFLVCRSTNAIVDSLVHGCVRERPSKISAYVFAVAPWCGNVSGAPALGSVHETGVAAPGPSTPSTLERLGYCIDT